MCVCESKCHYKNHKNLSRPYGTVWFVLTLHVCAAYQHGFLQSVCHLVLLLRSQPFDLLNETLDRYIQKCLPDSIFLKLKNRPEFSVSLISSISCPLEWSSFTSYIVAVIPFSGQVGQRTIFPLIRLPKIYQNYNLYRPWVVRIYEPELTCDDFESGKLNVSNIRTLDMNLFWCWWYQKVLRLDRNGIGAFLKIYILYHINIAKIYLWQ